MHSESNFNLNEVKADDSLSRKWLINNYPLFLLKKRFLSLKMTTKGAALLKDDNLTDNNRKA